MQRNRLYIGLIGCLLAVFSCQKDNTPSVEPGSPEYNDADYFMDGLVRKKGEEYLPLQGYISEGSIRIPVASVFEAERHFRSLLPPDAVVREEMNSLVWVPDDEKDNPQGEVVFYVDGEGLFVAHVKLPDSFPEAIRTVLYLPSVLFLDAVNPAVREDLEDNYYYGAIVDIADHGYGSGKFVVFREYNFENGAPGMAVRIDNHYWEPWELKLKDNAARVFERASCLSTLETAGAIYRKDKNILSKQLKNAGCNHLDQHYGSSTTTWNGWHYYCCLHEDKSGWIGPINDLEFYECWIYWFKPKGNSIVFW